MERGNNQIKVRTNNIEVKDMVDVVSDVITNKYTRVYAEKNFQFNAPHTFLVRAELTGETLSGIHFQEGPIKENGVNGVCGEDLIAMVIDRLEHFQESEFKCEENQKAIECLYASLEALRSRTNKREAKGIEGTHIVG